MVTNTSVQYRLPFHLTVNATNVVSFIVSNTKNISYGVYVCVYESERGVDDYDCVFHAG